MTETRKDWPLGPALRAARERKGISAREAARRTDGVVSSGRWYQLETGWQKNKGMLVPIGTTPASVVAAARAVDWDQAEALRIAGFGDYSSPDDWEPSRSALADLSDDDLLDEIRRRMEARHAVAATPQPRTPGETDEGEKTDELVDGAKDRETDDAAHRAARRMREAAEQDREVQ